jgi:hypothetical protein
MENKLKHLEFIQAVINRMANTSSLLKGWSIAIIAALKDAAGARPIEALTTRRRDNAGASGSSSSPA